MEQLGTLGVGSILKDGSSLGPGDEGSIGRPGGVDVSTGGTAASAEGSDVRGVGEGELSTGGGTSTDPGRVLSYQGVKPFDTEGLDAVCFVSSRSFKR